jgi:dolichyl-phosphate-mannose--protein O-mannosyl transferase
MYWYDRSHNFWQAIRDGEFEETYQQYHPGVTTMWVAGLGMEAYRVANDWSLDDVPSNLESGPQGGIAQAAVVTMGIVIAACISLVYFLLTRTTNWLVAFSGGILLGLDPFFLTHSKMIHVDAFLAIFMLVSAVSWLVYLDNNRRVYLVLSGVFAGLAFSSNSQSKTDQREKARNGTP